MEGLLSPVLCRVFQVWSSSLFCPLSIVFMGQVHPLPSGCLGSFKFMKFPVYPPGLGFTLHTCGIFSFLYLVSCLLFSHFSIKDVASFYLGVLCVHISSQIMAPVFCGLGHGVHLYWYLLGRHTLGVHRHSWFILVLYIVSTLVKKTFFFFFFFKVVIVSVCRGYNRQVPPTLEWNSDWNQCG